MPARDTDSPLPSRGIDMDTKAITEVSGGQLLNLTRAEPDDSPASMMPGLRHGETRATGSTDKFSSSSEAKDGKAGGIDHKGGSGRGYVNRPSKSNHRFWARAKMLLGFW